MFLLMNQYFAKCTCNLRLMSLVFVIRAYSNRICLCVMTFNRNRTSVFKALVFFMSCLVVHERYKSLFYHIWLPCNYLSSLDTLLRLRFSARRGVVKSMYHRNVIWACSSHLTNNVEKCQTLIQRKKRNYEV